MEYDWTLNAVQEIGFVLVDSDGQEVAGLGDSWDIELRKVGGVFTAAAGTKAEVGDGWYRYVNTSPEADTIGQVDIRIIGAGIVQQNLIAVVRTYQVAAREFTYLVDDGVNPLDGASVWVTTDAGGQNTIWAGQTNAFGIARAFNGDLPLLDDGSYYFWSQKARYLFPNPDTETVSATDTSGGTSGTFIGSATPLSGGDFRRYSSQPMPLELWREIVGYNPFHFWGIAGTAVPITSQCNGALREYAWQGADAVSRSDIRRAIASAEGRLFELLRFRVGARYVAREIRHPRPADARLRYIRPVGADGRYLAVATGEGYIREMGIEALTIIDRPTVIYTDEDGDGVIDQFAVAVATAVTDPEQLAVYFGVTDRRGQAVSDRWRIEPVYIHVAGGVATITGPAWLLVKPIRYEGVAATSITPPAAPVDTAVYAEYLDVYWRRTDGEGQSPETAAAVLVWEADPPPWAWPMTADCCQALNFDPGRRDPASLAYAVARASIRDRRGGLVYAGEATLNDDGDWVGRGWSGCRQPDRVILRYLAGARPFEVEEVTRGANWRDILFRLSIAELEGCFCTDHRANQILAEWQVDLAVSVPKQQTIAISNEQLNSPLGTRRGAVYAWNQIKHLRLARGKLI